jgi:poly-beta-1,6-N-acetyl-D-glucosamine synthase
VYEARFQAGTAYVVGFGFAYQTVRALSRLSERPFVVGSALIIAGYLWALVSRKPRVVSDEIVRFIRREQVMRLASRLGKR